VSERRFLEWILAKEDVPSVSRALDLALFMDAKLECVEALKMQRSPIGDW
jgi:hypothetical protein